MQSQRRQDDLFVSKGNHSVSQYSKYMPQAAMMKKLKLNLWRPTGASRTNTQKRSLFIIGDWNAKVRSQEIPEATGKFGCGIQNKAGQRLTEFCRERAGHIKHLLSTTQEKTLHMDITRWSIPKSDWLYYLQPKMKKLYTVSKNKTRSWLWLRSWTPYCQVQS